jgi:hypothetical protein
MNAISCPQCSAVNPSSAMACRQCTYPFSNLPHTSYISVPMDQVYGNPGSFAGNIPRDNEIGRNAFFWYRIYCGCLIMLYFALAALGLFLVAFVPDTGAREDTEVYITGMVYGILGLIFGIIFLIALLLPRKPWNWIVGIIMIALGMTSCCTLPALIPLLIYWLKPETKVYFGRNP